MDLGMFDGGIMDRFWKCWETGVSIGCAVGVILHHHAPLGDDLDIVRIFRCRDSGRKSGLSVWVVDVSVLSGKDQKMYLGLTVDVF